MSEEFDIPLPDYEAIPSDRLWFDPMALIVNTYMQFHDVAFVGLDTKNVLPANNARWGVGFFQASASANIQVAPWPDVQAINWQNISLNLTYLWYNLFTIGPIVCNDWWVYAPNATTLRCVELIRRG